MKPKYYILILFLVCSVLGSISGSNVSALGDRHDVRTLAWVRTVQFSPDKAADEPIGELIARAKKNVYVSIFSFTSNEISEYLIKAKQYNPQLDIKVIVDYRQASRTTIDEELLDHIQLKYDRTSGYHHNKYIVVDGKYVMTGSMNFSRNGQHRNRENYIILSSKRVAFLYENNFMNMWVGLLDD